ncbi:hypothetical protein AB0M83_11830 [Amycolatopsis sp. NPDC051106]|uniref:hypothetical protein n=1 Tax=unclassified Amycolatopsis TaxID=2618356 RepID=UPI003433FD36
MLAWTVLITLGLAGVVAAYQAAAGLLATGVRVEGVVLAVHQPSRGTSSFWVRYHSPGKSWTEEIVRDSARVYYVGDAVTVVGFAGLPFAAKAAVGRRRRARAVAHTGWRIATVTVVPGFRARSHNPEILVRYRDGREIVLRTAISAHGAGYLVGEKDRRAWIGGWGRRMAVLFPYGPGKPRPHAVPAYAEEPRVD